MAAKEMEESTESGAEVFADALVGQVRRDDVASMVQHQREMLSRFEKTNEMLINFNMLSSSRFETTSQEFKRHTMLLYDMKKDLDIVFRRIRKLKQRLSKMHPEAFSACSNVYNFIEAEDDDEDDDEDEDSGEFKVTAAVEVKVKVSKP
ncbi:kxDL motif-containing protein 1-like [Haliotis rufescens]|uniref:kxDL motif-containing protein 1-like n=1 Tax=Haliotis rufescens TaxID=6454 RepID=UPI001EAFDC8C|nr:kxDL motif-containing protein 1-like [Haliotis rufescens]